jgi:hypothetical protein
MTRTTRPTPVWVPGSTTAVITHHFPPRRARWRRRQSR